MSLGALIPLLIFVSVLLIVIATFLAISAQRSRRDHMHRRMTEFGGTATTESELMRIRQGRSLSSEGHYSMPFISLNQLILQSGVTVGAQAVIFVMIFLTAGSYFVLAIFLSGGFMAAAGALMIGVGLPVLVMRSMRASRQRKFEEQLPDALEIVVRGLKAGHSIPIAITTVGTQMPQPVGNEFSITGSELTYGLDLETALGNLRSRVGQADLTLFVLAVSIQSRMGGNLAEILTNLADIIRQRFKLRRKAKALSAEGRYSAILLSLMPVALFGVLLLIAPGYYGDVWDDWFIKPALGAAVAWMILGNFVMSRMVKFNV